MPVSLFLFGGLIGAVIGGYICYCIGRKERDDLTLDNKLLKRQVKSLRESLKIADDLINTQRRYINQIDGQYPRKEEVKQCGDLYKEW